MRKNTIDDDVIKTEKNDDITVDDFSTDALNDPILLLREMESLSTTHGNKELTKTQEAIVAVDDSAFINFINEVRSPNMTYSYKPLLIRAMMELANVDGEVELSQIVEYFFDYYYDRYYSGHVVEKSNSTFVKYRGDKERARHTILIYPFKRYEERGMMKRDKKRDVLFIVPDIWDNISKKTRREIISMCDENLDKYFDKL